MRPSRVLLLRCVAAAAAIVAVFAVLGHVTRSTKSPLAGAPQGTPGTVLLVPGYGGATGGVHKLAARLHAAGRDAVVVDLPGDGTGDLRDSARKVSAAADAAIAAGAPSVDLIGYSAGGVVARLYAADAGATKVRRVVTLGSPHHGTDVATLAATFAADACPAACLQLTRDSDLLKGLDETPDGPLWLSLWTEQDETVTPADSAHLDGAVNVVLQDVCPGVRVTHGDLPTTPLVAGIVLQALGTTPLTRPMACGTLQALGR